VLPPGTPPPKLQERIKRRMGRWILRRLQKRVEKEWREYDHSPRVTLGPWLPGRQAQRGETQVYRSFVQIHFHPRSRPNDSSKF
jgi:hypothetical protein